jgi:hypothetical protein
MAQKLQRDAEHNLQSFGQGGFDIISSPTTGSTTVDGDWVAVTAVGDAATKCALITSIGDNFTASGNAAGAKIKIASGQVIYGNFTQIIVPSQGSATKYLLAYRRVV